MGLIITEAVAVDPHPNRVSRGMNWSAEVMETIYSHCEGIEEVTILGHIQYYVPFKGHMHL